MPPRRKRNKVSVTSTVKSLTGIEPEPVPPRLAAVFNALDGKPSLSRIEPCPLVSVSPPKYSKTELKSVPRRNTTIISARTGRSGSTTQRRAPLSPASALAPLMPHAQRRELIEAPFHTRRIPGKTWAGVLISDAVPTSGQRAFKPTYNEDESYLRYGRNDDARNSD